MSINSSIFRAYDIRGAYPDDLNEEIAYKIGCAFAAYLKENNNTSKKIVVGYDARVSSPILKKSFIEGVINEGVNIWDIGLATVDMVYFASGYFHFPAVMITASHNSKEWNGFKLMKSDVDFFPVKNLEAIISEEKTGVSEEKGVVTNEDIKSDYINHVLETVDVEKIRPIKIAVDMKSDAVGKIFKAVLEKLPVEISAENYNFGCSFDSDGDRVNFTDERGESISSSIIGALMVRHFLEKNPNGKIVYSAIVSKIVPDTITACGGEGIRERVGHAFIKRRLKEMDGILGIETSGHYYFRKNFYADSGIISFLIMLEILSNENKSLSVLASEFSKYFSISEINFSVDDPEEVIKKVAKNFEGYNLDWLDGLSVITPDFWLNLRPSNTEPLIRLNIEANDEIILNRVKDNLINLINSTKGN